MKKFSMFLFFIVGMLVISGCTNRWEEETIEYIAPNWTSDGKVVFIENKIIWQYEDKFLFPEKAWMESQELWLRECNNDGTGMERKGLLFAGEPSAGTPNNTSSAGDWVTFSINDTREIYVVRRDGSGLEKVGDGRYPDFSPDASQIVYEKKDNGIWVMDRDGGNEEQIISNADARYPTWSSDGERIAYTSKENKSLLISDTLGSIIDSLIPNYGALEKPDWGPVDSNALVAYHNGRTKVAIIYCKNDSLNYDRLLPFICGGAPKWSQIGDQIIGYDDEGHYVIKIDGTNKWYLKP